MKFFSKIIFFVLISVFISGCSSSGWKNVTTEEAKNMLGSNPDEVVLIDVRTIEEYNSGHIPEAKLFPLQTLEAQLGELDKEKEILVICRSGNRSQSASDILINNGFKTVYNVEGGMQSWNYEVVK
ncbi:MAG: Rhodanese-related sulfurtransferase [Bacillales bacterium]|jgi:rhodanese-related sulfurtransferase|nr:Rhodanese-related sulfurtransferase [Bacillales bacterium]